MQLNVYVDHLNRAAMATIPTDLSVTAKGPLALTRYKRVVVTIVAK